MNRPILDDVNLASQSFLEVGDKPPGKEWRCLWSSFNEEIQIAVRPHCAVCK